MNEHPTKQSDSPQVIDAARLARESRNFKRIDTTLDVAFKLESAGKSSDVYRGKTCNLSYGGLCLKVENDVDKLLIDLATKVDSYKLRLELGDDESPVELEAVTRWTTSKLEWIHTPDHTREIILAGVAFIQVSETTKEKLARFLNNPAN